MFWILQFESFSFPSFILQLWQTETSAIQFTQLFVDSTMNLTDYVLVVDSCKTFSNNLMAGTQKRLQSRFNPCEKST